MKVQHGATEKPFRKSFAQNLITFDYEGVKIKIELNLINPVGPVRKSERVEYLLK